MMPIAFVGGPLLGGFLTEHASWRWVFYVNLPIGALALIVSALVMKLPRQRIQAKIDYVGMLLLSVGLVTLTLLASWGGNQYAWGSWVIILLGVVSVVTLVSFVYAETKVSEPVLPPRLFRDRNFIVAQILSFILGASMFGVVNFLPQYMQYVQGASPTASGLLLLPLMFGMLVVMIGTGQYVTRTGKYRIFPIIGGAVITVGMMVLLQLGVHTSEMTSSLLTIFVGIGMGFVMQLTMLITQNSAPLRDMGAASGSVTLFRTIGGSLGIAVLGSIYTRQLTDTLTKHLGKTAGHQITSSSAQIPPSELHKLPSYVVSALKEGVTSGLHGVLICGAVLSVIAFVAAFFIRHVPLRGGEPAGPQDTVASDTPAPQDVM
jgi:MFS family permease